MFAAWTWPQEFGQPVKWMRSGFGATIFLLSASMIASAGFLVSMIPFYDFTISTCEAVSGKHMRRAISDRDT